jgi:hypothetical protein
LSCDGAKIAGQEFVIKPISSSLEYTCVAQAGTNYDISSDPEFKFLIGTVHSSGTSTGTGSSTTTERMTPKLPDFEPISGVAFFPNITGILSSNNSVNPDYPGIITPKSQWCTDSCGIASIKIRPVS